jgi:hypothetical protein
MAQRKPGESRATSSGIGEAAADSSAERFGRFEMFFYRLRLLISSVLRPPRLPRCRCGRQDSDDDVCRVRRA